MRRKLAIGAVIVSLLFLQAQNAYALNKVNNWDFNGNATGWTSTNGSGTDASPSCSATGSSTTNSMATFQYNSSLSSQTAFEATTPAVKNVDYRGFIYQSITAPGSGTVKTKGKFSYYATSSAWGSGWVRLDIYNSDNTSFIANLDCITFSANTAWTTRSFGGDVSLTGGTTYTIRVTLQAKTKANSNTAITVGVDNVAVNLAPTGLSASAAGGTTNASLTWTASTAGTGANGLHATTPYKVYRDTGSPVSTFLSNGTTNSYTDSATTGNTTYYYAVTDVDTASDESPKSAESSVLTLPGAPTGLTFSNIQSTSLRVEWTSPSGGAASYKVERCQGTLCSDFSQIASGVTNAYYDDSPLSASTTYRYRVRANNSSGDSPYSGENETTTDAASIISVTLTSDGEIQYGLLGSSESKTTLTLTDTQTAQNDGNVTEKFNIKASNATGGTAWTLGDPVSTNVFKMRYSINGTDWTTLTTADSYQTLAQNITSTSSQNFDLELTAPSSSSDAAQKTITITIQAEQQP